MKLNAPKTLRLLLLVLTLREFSQRGLWSRYKESGTIALGQVNKVVRWLEGNMLVERRKGRYVLSNPTGLLRAISLFRPMRELRAFSSSVDLPRQEVMESLRERAIFCLGTALEKYGSYFRSPEISFYAVDWRRLENGYAGMREGLTKLTCYRMDFLEPGALVLDSSQISLERQVDDLISKHSDGSRYTSEVLTVLDMFCDGKAHYTKELLKDVWGVEL